MAEEVGQAGAYRVLTAAIGEGDPDTARAAAERVLRPAPTPCSPPSTPSTGGPMTDQTAPPEIEQLAASGWPPTRPGSPGPGAPTSPSAPAWRSFWRHPSPWMISSFLVGSVVARVVVGGGSWWELLIPAALVALFPVIEWVIHVGILHWRPRRVGPVEIDSLLARKHREHHADPRDIPLVFIPWQVLAWLLPAYVVVALLAMPTPARRVVAAGVGLRAQVRLRVDPLPRAQRLPARSRGGSARCGATTGCTTTRTSTTGSRSPRAGTADRLFGTYPDPETVQTSGTAKNLHGERGPSDPP